MNSAQDDLGIITAVFAHLDLEAIPRALAIKAEMDAGVPLNELDLLFFEECLDEVANLLYVIDRYPDYQLVTSKMVELCHEITQKAFENQLGVEANSPLLRFHSKLKDWPR